MNPAAQLKQAGLEATKNRRLVLGAVLKAGEAVTPPALLRQLDKAMNRVTLYRILDLLVSAGLIEKHSGAGRAYHYCPGHGHGHFHCIGCDRMLCLKLPQGALDPAALITGDIARIDSIELRIDGLCADCAGK